MSHLNQNQKYFQFFVKFNENDYTIDVKSSEEVIKLCDILPKIKETIDSEISFKTHAFEVKNEILGYDVKLLSMSLISDQTVICIKPKEMFECMVELWDNENKFNFKAVVDNCFTEEHKYSEILAKCEQICGHKLPEETSFWSIDQKIQKYEPLNRKMSLISEESIIKVVSSSEHKAIVSDGMTQIKDNQIEDYEPIVKKQKNKNKTETNLSPTLSQIESQRKLRYNVEYNEKAFTIDIEGNPDYMITFKRIKKNIIRIIKNNMDSKFNFINHNFEIYNEETNRWNPITKRQFVPNMSRIRVTAISFERFHCFVDIYIENQMMCSFEVKQNCTKGKNSLKRNAICNQCIINGRKLPMNFKFTVFDENCGKYVKPIKTGKSPVFGSKIRIDVSQDFLLPIGSHNSRKYDSISNVGSNSLNSIVSMGETPKQPITIPGVVKQEFESILDNKFQNFVEKVDYKCDQKTDQIIDSKSITLSMNSKVKNESNI